MTQETWDDHEAITQTTGYFDNDELAPSVFVGKYALRNNDDQVLEPTPDYMHRRLAREFARIEAKYPNPLSEERIYGLLSKRPGRLGMGPVIPQGSPMSGIGNPYRLQSLSNCFVIPSPVDSYGGILFTDQEQAQVMKRRGGVGFDISQIRPRGLKTANAAGTTDGIGIFMERFSNTCREVAQGGRRGALMLTVSVKHPEIETFIHIKRDKTKVTGANVSIRVTDDFMQAVDDDAHFTLQWPVDVSLEQATVTRRVRARDIWEQIVDAAWDSAEPGVLFWDAIERMSPADAYASCGFRSTSTNPCGEIPISGERSDSCRLLVVDLTHFVFDPFKSSTSFDFAAFNETVQDAQRLMDDLVDLELEAVDAIIAKVKADAEPEHVKRIELELWERIRSAGKDGRRTGLGITGLGDALAMLNIQYGSQASVDRTGEIYRELALGAYRSTVTLAKERGAFPVYDFDLEKDHPFLKKVMNADKDLARDWKRYGRRNIALTTTAPVGSVSTLTQTTSGIEPAFLLSYTRRKKVNPNDKNARVDFVDRLGDRWTEFPVYHHNFKTWMDVTGKTDVRESPYHQATSNDVDWLMSVKLQAAAQEWVCHSISKTCNLPQDASHDTISKVYLEAWRSGCKGFTVYRDRSRDGVLVSDTKVSIDLNTRYDGVPTEEVETLYRLGRKYQQHMPAGYIKTLSELETYLTRRLNRADVTSDDSDVKVEQIIENHAPKRPKELPCDIHQVKVSGESWTMLVGLFGDQPYEVFGGLSQYVEIPRKWKQGKLQKNGKKDGITTYNLAFGPEGEEVKVKDVISVFENATHGAFTRTISLALRHGIPIQYVCEQLMKDKHSDMQSFSRVTARVLKTYIKNGTSSGETTCWGCGVKGSLTYQEGCVACKACGASKCG
jgi:ribonucleoside-diphosphate reductase alpha chain